MAIRNILQTNDPALRKKSRIVTDFNKRLHILIDDMRETLVDANGLGLAAPQVGVLRRVVLIVDIESGDEEGAGDAAGGGAAMGDTGAGDVGASDTTTGDASAGAGDAAAGGAAGDAAAGASVDDESGDAAVDANETKHSGFPEGKIIELINPEILAKSGEQTGNEGCLSVPGVYGIVTRPALVKVRAQDRNGNTFELWTKELTARAICHEIDHLEGIIFTSLTDHFLTEEEVEALFAEKERGKAGGSDAANADGSGKSAPGAGATDADAPGKSAPGSGATDADAPGSAAETNTGGQ